MEVTVTVGDEDTAEGDEDKNHGDGRGWGSFTVPAQLSSVQFITAAVTVLSIIYVVIDWRRQQIEPPLVHGVRPVQGRRARQQ